jgi:hypothetical protein
MSLISQWLDLYQVVSSFAQLFHFSSQSPLEAYPPGSSDHAPLSVIDPTPQPSLYLLQKILTIRAQDFYRHNKLSSATLAMVNLP